jgi:hypothetical protein
MSRGRVPIFLFLIHPRASTRQKAAATAIARRQISASSLGFGVGLTDSTYQMLQRIPHRIEDQVIAGSPEVTSSLAQSLRFIDN